MLLDRANKLPPFVCRMIARVHVSRAGKFRWAPQSHATIAKRANIPRSTVALYSSRTSWKGIPIDVIDRFASACGVDLNQPGRHLRWLRATRFLHLSQGNAQQRRFFARLMKVKTSG